MGRICAKCSGNVTVYQEMQVYAETQVHTTRWMEGGGDGKRRQEGGDGKRMCETSWSRLFPYVYAINLRREESIALISFAQNLISKTAPKMVCQKSLIHWNVI